MLPYDIFGTLHKKFSSGGINVSTSKIRQRLGFGAADMASNFVWPMVTTYLTVFYTDVAGVSAITVGTIMLISKLIDAVTDILMGILVDHTRTRWGKCRPYFLFGAIPLALFAVLTFLIPPFDDTTSSLIYIFVSFNLLSTAYTVVNTPLSAILPSLSSDKNERNVLVTFRLVMAAVGSFSVTTFATPLISLFGGRGNDYSFTLTMSVFSVIAVALFLFSFFNTKEVVKPQNPQKVTVRQGLKAVNRQYVLFVVIMFVFMLGFAIKQAGVVYYYTYVVENVAIIPVQAAVTSLAMIAGQLCIPVFCKFAGKKNSVFIMSAIAFLGNIIFIVSNHSTALLLAGTAVVWYALGFMMGMRFSILADVVEYCEKRTGIQAAGMLSSLDSFVAKLTFGLNVTVFTALMEFGGYVPNAVQTDFEKFCINVGFIGIPMLCVVVTAVLFIFFKVEKYMNGSQDNAVQAEQTEQL